MGTCVSIETAGKNKECHCTTRHGTTAECSGSYVCSEPTAGSSSLLCASVGLVVRCSVVIGVLSRAQGSGSSALATNEER